MSARSRHSVAKFLLLVGNPGRTFYVDFTGGLDSNSGLIPALAWKTITKVNGFSLLPGDKVLFKRGETWAGIRLTAATGVTYSAYGSGALPTINGSDTVDCFAVGSGYHYVTFRNLHATHGIDFGFFMLGAYAVKLFGCEADNCGNDGIIFITGSHHCYAYNCYSHDNYERVVGPLTTGMEISDGSYNITVTNFRANNNAGSGISIHSHVATVMPYNVTITNATCDGNRDFGINVMKQNTDTDTDRNINLINCTGTNGTSTVVISFCGLSIIAAASCLLQGVTVTGFKSTGNAQRPLYVNRVKNINISRSVFAQAIGSAADNDSRFDTVDTVNIFNNVFYSVLTNPIDFRGTNSAVLVKNNVIMRNGSNGDVVEIITTAGLTLDYNLYKSNQANSFVQWRWAGSYYNWTDFLTNSGQEAHSATPADPLFVDQTSPAWDFHLQAGSPAIDKGVVIPGITDGFLGVAPDCGAYEKA